MRSIHVPPDQLEGQYQVFHGETNEGAILLRMARKYKRLLYHNRIIFFDKCSIDPEARLIVLKYRTEYGVHAYNKLAERCKELLEEQESWLHQVYKSRATYIFQKDLSCIVG
jgi:hypothetical protein